MDGQRTKGLAKELRGIISKLKKDDSEREIDALMRALKDPLTEDEAKRALSLAWEIALSNLAILRFFLSRKRSSFPYSTVDVSDLFHSGVIALFMAALKYDPEKASFSTFAKYYLSNSLRTEAFRFCHIISIPDSALKREGSRAKEMATALFRTGPVSLFDQSDGSDSKDQSLLEKLPDGSEPVEDAAARLELKRALSKTLERLPERERKILLLRALGRPLRDLARDFGISHERIRQLSNRAIHRIKSRVFSESPELERILFEHWKEL